MMAMQGSQLGHLRCLQGVKTGRSSVQAAVGNRWGTGLGMGENSGGVSTLPERTAWLVET